MADRISSNHFFRLPTELRQEIYSRLWGPEIVKLSIPHGSAVFCPSDIAHMVHVGESQKLPPWLLVSKRMCREGLDQLCWNRQISARSWGGGQSKAALILPLISTVVLETIGSCWHASPSEDNNREFRTEDHPRLHAQLRFPNYKPDDSAVSIERIFNFTLDTSHVSLLQSLFELGAPIREVCLMACMEKGMIAAKNYYAVCSGENGLVEELPASLRSGSVQTAMLLGDDDWQVELIEKEPLEESALCIFDFYYTVHLKWTRKEDGC